MATNKDFKLLSIKEENQLTLEELKNKRTTCINLGEDFPEVLRYKESQFFHLILYKLIKVMRLMNGFKLFVSGVVPHRKISRPIIVAPNHVCKEDIEILMEAIPLHMYLLSGDFENVHRTLSGTMLEKNGIIYFDMTDSCDRKNIKKVIKNVLDNNINLLWFYEGSWNLSENKPYYDGYYHMVQAAVDSNALVLPISFDLIEKNACVEIGEFIDFSDIYKNKNLTHQEKIEGLDLIKGQIGSGLFNIWEQHSKECRRNIPNDYWEKHKKEVLSKWKFSEKDIEDKHFKDGKIATETAFLHLNNLTPNKNNAFLFNKRLFK